VIAIIAALSAILIGVFSRSRNTAARAQCDMRIKAIVMALDAFRQENGVFPNSLQELVTKKYLTDPQMLRCPRDPRPTGSYDDFYVLRSSRDSDELPIVVCPLCENDGAQGIQSFKGRYTKQFATRPAELLNPSGATIDRPGKVSIAGKSGMLLRGGDSIRTGSGGQATLRFADGSTSEIKGSSEITVLQSFISGHNRAPLYTLIRQTAGDVIYKVNHGSKFDVTTPTATAGALGTEFEIREDSSTGNWYLKVIESKVFCSMNGRTKVYTDGSSTLMNGTPLTGVFADLPVLAGNNEVTIGTGSEITTTSTTNTNDGSTSSKKKKAKKPTDNGNAYGTHG
jgi:hypothetical protein